MLGRAVAGLALAIGALACAPAHPLLTGATTTPQDRAAVALGGAARIPLGTSLPEDPASPGGVVPVAAFRHGIAPNTDVGAMVAGTLGRIDIRQQLVVQEDIVRMVLTGAIAPYVGAVDEGGLRYGADLPLTFAVDGDSLVELWIGPRLGVERAESDAEGWATGFRVGGVVGLGFGFRHLHALVELTTHYETWSGQVDRDGVVLTRAERRGAGWPRPPGRRRCRP